MPRDSASLRGACLALYKNATKMLRVGYSGLLGGVGLGVIVWCPLLRCRYHHPLSSADAAMDAMFA